MQIIIKHFGVQRRAVSSISLFPPISLAAHPPSTRIMSPLGFQTHRQARYEDLPFYDDDPDYYDLPPRSRPVPIWLCVFLVVSYIIAGAFIFSKWETWSLLDSAYFCFITLTTIGENIVNKRFWQHSIVGFLFHGHQTTYYSHTLSY